MPAASTQNLGVIFYGKFYFREHISKICWTCYYNIPNLWRFGQYLPLSIAKTIVTVLATNRLDYCNLLFHTIAIKDITKLQSVQNYKGCD